jgi:hypothetical protein
MATRHVSIAVLVSSFAIGSARAEPPGAQPDVAVRDLSVVDWHGRVYERWQPTTLSGVPLDPAEFYRRVGRPDLVAARERRRALAIGTALGAAALTGVSIYFVTRAATMPPLGNCDPSLTFQQFNACVQQSQASFQAAQSAQMSNAGIAVGTLLGAGISLGISAWLFGHPEPISEAEAMRLAAGYSTAPRLSVAPYADRSGGGLMLRGSF